MKERYNNFYCLLKEYIKNAPIWFFVICLSTLIEPLIAYIDVVIIKVSVDSVEFEREFSEILLSLGTVLIIYIVVNSVNSFIEIFYGEKINCLVSNRINKNIFSKIVLLKYSKYDNTAFYDSLIWAIENYYRQVFFSAQIVWQFLMAILTVGTIGTLIITMDYMVLIIVVLSVVLSVYINGKIVKVYYNQNSDSIEGNKIMSYIRRLFMDRKYAFEIKVSDSKKILNEKYELATESLVAVVDKYKYRATGLSIIRNSIEYVFKVSILIYLVYGVYNNLITLGEFTALYYASINLKSQLEKFGGLFNRLNEITLYSKKINDFLLDIDVEKSEDEKMISNEDAISIEFKNVSFKYDSDGKYVLKDISFKIKKGQKILIVGDNGSGKSTIIKLLLRLYEPTSGQILINNVSINQYNLENLRKNMRCLFQDSGLYAFSVFDNLRIYNSDISKYKLLESIEEFEIKTMLEKNHASLDTMVTRELGDEGVLLSGGEEQMLLISRLFIDNFSCLLVDEPTTFLDKKREKNFNEIIEKQKATVVYVSHNFLFAKAADEIIWLEKGNIKIKGTHCQLMKMSDEYGEMYNDRMKEDE